GVGGGGGGGGEGGSHWAPALVWMRSPPDHGRVWDTWSGTSHTASGKVRFRLQAGHRSSSVTMSQSRQIRASSSGSSIVVVVTLGRGTNATAGAGPAAQEKSRRANARNPRADRGTLRRCYQTRSTRRPDTGRDRRC